MDIHNNVIDDKNNISSLHDSNSIIVNNQLSSNMIIPY